MQNAKFMQIEIGRGAITMPNLKAIAQLLSKIRWGDYFTPPPRLNYGHTDTPVKLGLREEILGGRKFGGFGGFCQKLPN